jgi:hypothetical protein
MIFLTYNDSFSGIYKSQVIDVCSFMEKELGVKTRLVAFVSARTYFQQRKLIKTACNDAWVLPMFPKVRFWKRNAGILKLICNLLKERVIWARGPFACNLALELKEKGLVDKVLFDARGAYVAELTEYDVVGDELVNKDIARLEKAALRGSAAQLAVSHHLQAWWKDEFDFTPQNCEVIPCTLSELFLEQFPTEEEIKKKRAQLGFSETDTVLVYSGSSAGWQSFELVDKYLYTLMDKNERIKLLFLSNHIPRQARVFTEFADRIISQWVKPGEVRGLLLAADHGLLVREKSVTNEVSSPVKFAEYLSCGLNVTISEGIGDFTDFVRENECGSVVSSNLDFEPLPYTKKLQNYQLAIKHFSKTSEFIKQAYSNLLANLK